MAKAILTIADLVPSLDKLRTELEETEKIFKFMGNYQKRLLAHKIELTNVPIKNLLPFLTSMRSVVAKFQLLEEAKVDVPGNISSLYTDIRDTIYRAGKYEEGGVNQNPNGIKISNKKIFLGNPPGNHKHPVSSILKKWKKCVEFERDTAVLYAIEAWYFIQKYFALIQKIELLQKRIMES